MSSASEAAQRRARAARATQLIKEPRVWRVRRKRVLDGDDGSFDQPGKLLVDFYRLFQICNACTYPDNNISFPEDRAMFPFGSLLSEMTFNLLENCIQS